MTPDDTPAMSLLPDGAVLLSYTKGGALRGNWEGMVAVLSTDYTPLRSCPDWAKPSTKPSAYRP